MKSILWACDRCHQQVLHQRRYHLQNEELPDGWLAIGDYLVACGPCSLDVKKALTALGLPTSTPPLSIQERPPGAPGGGAAAILDALTKKVAKAKVEKADADRADAFKPISMPNSESVNEDQS
jgi:hypothetical protein